MNPLQVLSGLIRRWLLSLDSEKVATFQTMYYRLFTVGAIMLMVFPGIHVESMRRSLNSTNYAVWLIVTFICPILTLVGRKLTHVASFREPDQPNPAYGAAILQLVGDLGVWACVNIYIVSFVQSGTWVQEFLSFIFLVMGVLGGGMFTVRSLRRLTAIERRNRREREGQIDASGRGCNGK